MTRALAVRSTFQPGDLGEIIRMHGVLYAKEHGFDVTFESYVAGPLADFARRGSSRERIWLAEEGSRLVGVVAIVEAEPEVAQLRWFLVYPEARGMGLGSTLLSEAVDFSRAAGYRSIILWTVRALEAAAHLYREAGFTLVEERADRHWGVDVIEERYEMRLG